MQGLAGSTEVLVVGGGPAGCACAIRLAQLGHAVTVVDRGGPGRPAAVESVPAAVLPLLATLGLQALVTQAGYLRPTGHWVQWAGPARRQAHAQPGFHLERARFDAMLRHAARRAGVQWLVASARPPERAGAGRWHVPLHDGRVWQAEALVLATGHGADGVVGGARCAALVGQWVPAEFTDPGAAPGELPRRAGALDALDRESRIQAGADAWAWAVPQADGGRTAALFVDARQLAGLTAEARRQRYLDGLAACDLLTPMLRGRRLADLRVADATPRRAARVVEPGLLRIGDAALALDPLSAQGVVSALRSGVQGAVALHTQRRRPHESGVAAAFLQAQQQREVERHARWRATFLAQALAQFGTPFWAGLAEGAPAGGQPARPAVDRPLPALGATLRLDGRVRFQPMPMLEGDWIVAAPALEHPGLPAPVGQVQGQPVAGLLAAVAPHNSVGRVLQAWTRLIGATAAVSLLQGWWRQGVVVGEAAAEDAATAAADSFDEADEADTRPMR